MKGKSAKVKRERAGARGGKGAGARVRSGGGLSVPAGEPAAVGGAPDGPLTGEAMKKFSRVMRAAVAAGATAVLIGPVFDEASQRSVPRLRFRVHGAVVEQERLSDEDYRDLVAKTKELADLDAAEQKLPQDGRMMLTVQGKAIDLMVGTAPCVLGEHVCLRVVAPAERPAGVGALGLPDAAAAAVRRWCGLPHGLVLLCGPAFPFPGGPLYALLAEVRGGRQVASVEDPVDAVLSGVNQIQVDRRAGLTLARALRVAMRQDPDVLAIRELRDGEAAELAVEAALAGHLVLAQMPAADATTGVAHLTGMGLHAGIVAGALVGVLAWRQVGRLCERCREEYEPAAAVLARLGTEAAALRGRAWRARGCAECRTGCTGAATLFEVLEVGDAIREAMRADLPAGEVRRLAGADAATTFLRSGIEKAAAGVVGLEEVLRLGC